MRGQRVALSTMGIKIPKIVSAFAHDSDDSKAHRRENMTVKFRLLEWDYATNLELQRFVHEGRDSIFDEYASKIAESDSSPIHGTDAVPDSEGQGPTIVQTAKLRRVWHHKAFNVMWLLDRVEFKEGMSILDVGASISRLPQCLASKFGVRAHVVDRYDTPYQEVMLREYGGKEAFFRLTPDVSYTEKFLGEGDVLEPESFDVVYSLSVLEHLDSKIMKNVFLDMARSTKIGGLMAHTIDLPMPTGIGTSLTSKINDPNSDRMRRIRELPAGRHMASILSKFGPWLASSPKFAPAAQAFFHRYSKWTSTTRRPYLLSADGWAKFVRRVLDASCDAAPQSTTSLSRTMVDRDILIENLEFFYRRWLPRDTPKPYWPGINLLFIAQRVS